MHQYIESVRNDLERKTGEEIYLVSSLFWRMQKNFHYEDEGKTELQTKDDFMSVRNKVVNLMHDADKWSLEDEVLSWQAGVLRDISKDHYGRWDQMLESSMLTQDVFQDGTPCVTLEASCEMLGSDPTQTYTALLEVKHVLTRLCTSSDKIVQEVADLQGFRDRIRNQYQSEEFAVKRVESETTNTILHKSIHQLEEVMNMCEENGSKLFGQGLLLWMTPKVQIESLIHALKSYLYCEYDENPELVLNKWIEGIFAETMYSGEYNPDHFGPLHMKVLKRMNSATQALIQYELFKKDSFQQRDKLMMDFLQISMESVMQDELAYRSSAGSDLETMVN